MIDILHTYHFYWGGPFSQWQKVNFAIDGTDFHTAEQAMMYFKAILFNDTEIALKILAAIDPGKQKSLGRQVRGFDDAVWDQHKVQIVKRVNYAKFDQNKGLRRKLFQTGARQLVEASPLDTVWGIGLDAQTAPTVPPTLWPGQNLLGKIVTEVREELREKYPDEVVAVLM